MANFRVGQKVACVRGQGKLLVEGKIYTIANIIHENGYDFIIPAESGTDRFGQKGWFPDRFRPLISQADDVEMFRKISEDTFGRLSALEEMMDEPFYIDETHK